MNKYIKIMLIVTVIFLSILTTWEVATQTQKPIILGDVNNDGIIDESDLELTHQHLLKSRELTRGEKTRADMNQDGEINLLDLFDIHMIIRGEQNGKHKQN